MQRQAIRQGFAMRSPQQARTVSSQILPPPPNPPPSRTAALAPPHPMIPVPVCSSTRTWISTSMFDVSMGLTDSEADAEGVTDDEVVVHSPTPSALHPLLRSSGTHDHLDGPMLGFVVREREVTYADTRTSLDHARANSDHGLDFDLTSLTSLGPSASGGEGWADWPTQRGLGGSSVSPDTGVGK